MFEWCIKLLIIKQMDVKIYRRKNIDKNIMVSFPIACWLNLFNLCFKWSSKMQSRYVLKQFTRLRDADMLF